MSDRRAQSTSRLKKPVGVEMIHPHPPAHLLLSRLTSSEDWFANLCLLFAIKRNRRSPLLSTSSPNPHPFLAKQQAWEPFPPTRPTRRIERSSGGRQRGTRREFRTPARFSVEGRRGGRASAGLSLWEMMLLLSTFRIPCTLHFPIKTKTIGLTLRPLTFVPLSQR